MEGYKVFRSDWTSGIPNMTIQQIEDFLRESRELVEAFGYEIKDEE